LVAARFAPSWPPVELEAKARRSRRNGGGATLAQSVEQLIRNQQVVGSNPTGGSKNSNKYKASDVHFGGHSVDLSRIARELSDFVKFRA
jgi:hypothetical protein